MTEIARNDSSDVVVMDVTSVEELSARFASMANGVAVFSSLDADDFLTKARVASAVSNSEPLAEILGTPLTLRNYVGQVIEMPDEKTGILSAVPRIILLCDEGPKHAISSGVMSALENITGILGQPSEWDGFDVVVEAVEERTRRGYRVMTLRIVSVTVSPDAPNPKA